MTRKASPSPASSPASSPAASVPVRPDPSTLRRALGEIKAGHFETTLAALSPYIGSGEQKAALLYAFCLAGLHQPEKAAHILCEVAGENPAGVHPLQELSDILAELDRRPDAVATCRAALHLAPQDARIYDVLANVLTQMGQFDEAVELLRHSTTLRPNATYSYNLLAMALAERGDMAEALAVLEGVLAAHPEHAGSLSNIGCILAGEGRFEEALDFYRRAIFYRPTDAQIRLNHSITLLKAGRFAQGWAEHEWRLKLPGHSSLPQDRLLPSLGPDTDLSGQRVLVTQEEGLGDTLMYLRYVEPLARRGAHVHLWVPDTLEQICRRVEGAGTVQVGGDVPPYDWHCPFISLPRVFAATADAMGAPVPYLKAGPEKVRAFARLLPDNHKLNVGLIWGGAPRPNLIGPHMVDRRRSMSLQTLEPLGSIPGINLISMQKGPYAEQMLDPPRNMTLYDPTDELHTMDDTASLMMSLDVIVSVDTSSVHLAGGLGKAVLLMDRYDNCWRWQHGREDSPWYPTLRIIRQTTPRKWEDVVGKVADRLRTMAAYRA
ncbi:tetratricopeptide repeat protein [Acetobacter farinalis]|uniref:Tetratricopeptide repeat protein n=1 Tax=Acetobacter farinalis TaxID=1260984 RepID=A0ABT3Q4J6_9PROT|nr:tetratricopeptide repeat protein [Acetobacter farinalis]MCX2560174.1 tetratricopeptide repeat protein [Acetobacter farinalis]NHO28829.1 tetratricopeptide repeat protein [Acetobacter farinalis]